MKNSIDLIMSPWDLRKNGERRLLESQSKPFTYQWRSINNESDNKEELCGPVRKVWTMYELLREVVDI